MKIEKYTQKMQSAVMDAQNLAMSYGNQAIEVEHLHYRQRSGRLDRKASGSDERQRLFI